MDDTDGGRRPGHAGRCARRTVPGARGSVDAVHARGRAESADASLSEGRRDDRAAGSCRDPCRRAAFADVRRPAAFAVGRRAVWFGCVRRVAAVARASLVATIAHVGCTVTVADERRTVTIADERRVSAFVDARGVEASSTRPRPAEDVDRRRHGRDAALAAEGSGRGRRPVFLFMSVSSLVRAISGTTEDRRRRRSRLYTERHSAGRWCRVPWCVHAAASACTGLPVLLPSALRLLPQDIR